jgi:signal transduction histidine kinase
MTSEMIRLPPPDERAFAVTTSGVIALLGALAFVAALGFAGYALRQAVVSGQAEQEHHLANTAHVLAGSIDARLDRYVSILKTLAVTELAGPPADLRKFHANAATVAEIAEGWIILIGTPPDFPISVNTLRPYGSEFPHSVNLVTGPVRDRIFNERLPAITDLYHAPLVGQLAVAIGIPVASGTEVGAALFIAIRPHAMEALLLSSDLGPTQFAALADSKGRIIDRTRGKPSERTGLPLPDWMQAGIAGRTEGFLRGIGMSGFDNVYAFHRPALAPNWVVLVGQPQSILGDAVWRPIWWLISGGLGVVATLSLAYLYRERSVTRDAAALRESRAMMRRLHRGLPAIVFLCDISREGDFTVSLIGGDFLRVTGWPAADLRTDYGWQQRRHPDAMDLRELFRTAVRDGAVMHEFRFLQPDGSWRWLRSEVQRLTARPDGGGEVVGYISDISGIRAATSRAIASARLASLGEMAKGIAHELRQPLAIISMAAENLQGAMNRGDTEAVERRLQRVMAQVDRAAGLIGQLSRFAAADSQPRDARPVDLNDALADAQRLVGPSLDQAAIHLQAELPADTDGWVQADPMALEQVLIHLLNNARDAIVANQADTVRRITVSAAPGELPQTLAVTVADTGGGIPDYVLQRLFEPFVTTKDPDRGTGLGLYVCRGLLAAMGGTIEAHNEANGAVIVVTLPAAIVQAKQDA